MKTPTSLDDARTGASSNATLNNICLVFNSIYILRGVGGGEYVSAVLGSGCGRRKKNAALVLTTAMFPVDRKDSQNGRHAQSDIHPDVSF